jgi:hypothetical protein
MPTAPAAVLATATPAQARIASGVVNTVQRLGSAFGVAAGWSLLGALTALRRRGHAPLRPPTPSAVAVPARP